MTFVAGAREQRCALCYQMKCLWRRCNSNNCSSKRTLAVVMSTVCVHLVVARFLFVSPSTNGSNDIIVISQTRINALAHAYWHTHTHTETNSRALRTAKRMSTTFFNNLWNVQQQKEMPCSTHKTHIHSTETLALTRINGHHRHIQLRTMRIIIVIDPGTCLHFLFFNIHFFFFLLSYAFEEHERRYFFYFCICCVPYYALLWCASMLW